MGVRSPDALCLHFALACRQSQLLTHPTCKESREKILCSTTENKRRVEAGWRAVRVGQQWDGVTGDQAQGPGQTRCLISLEGAAVGSGERMPPPLTGVSSKKKKKKK